MSVFKGFLYLITILSAIMTLLFVDFAYKTFSVKPSVSRADAIVVLTGGRGRIEEGLRLYGEGRAPWLFIIGVDPAVRKSELVKGKQGQKKTEGIILEQTSRNTMENAFYARDLIMGKEVGSIILITSRYHMKRASLLFKNLLPKKVAIHPYPVDSRNLKEKWWNDLGSFRLLFSEFYKYCMFRFFFFFASGELRP
jgi:uncharacterized SAM-binding protein YcdF (DUF218 family)